MLNWDETENTNTTEATAQAVVPPQTTIPEDKVNSALNTATLENLEQISGTAPLQDEKAPDSAMPPVRAEDKRVVNGQTDINQLAPFRYPWAWKYFLNANKNHWTPLDINMAQDVRDYHHTLTSQERHVYENVLSYLTTSDILAMRTLVWR